MKIYKCAIQRRTKHNGKARNKNTMWSWATSREWIYARAPARASKMAKWCTNTAATRILYLREETFYEKKLSLNEAIAVLRQSVGLPGWLVTVWKNRTRYTYAPSVTNVRVCTLSCDSDFSCAPAPTFALLSLCNRKGSFRIVQL